MRVHLLYRLGKIRPPHGTSHRLHDQSRANRKRPPRSRGTLARRSLAIRRRLPHTGAHRVENNGGRRITSVDTYYSLRDDEPIHTSVLAPPRLLYSIFFHAF